MKSTLRTLALLLALSLPARASEVGNYPNAGPLSGIERMLSDQGGNTVDITPNQLQAFLFPGGVLPINLGGTGAGLASTALNNLLPNQTGNNGNCLGTNGTIAAWQTCNSVLPGNPVALVGTTPINGVSTNFMRADAAPQINLAMAPSWTGNHTFAPASGTAIVANSSSASTPSVMFNNGSPGGDTLAQCGTSNSSGLKCWTSRIGATGAYVLGTATDAGADINNVLILNKDSSGNFTGAVLSATTSVGTTLAISGFPGQNVVGLTSSGSASLGITSASGATDESVHIDIPGTDAFYIGSNASGSTNAIGAPTGIDYIFTNQARCIDIGTSSTVRLSTCVGVQVGSPTGGDMGVGTINMTGCFINGVACASAGAAAAGSLTGSTLASGVVNSSLTSVGVLSSLVVGGNLAVTNSIVVNGVTNLGTGTINSPAIYVNSQPVYAGIPQNAQSGAYTLIASDANKHIYKGTGSSGLTIPANSSVAFPVGTAVTVINDGTGSMSISISSDTMVFSPSGSTGSRVLAVFGEATLLKVGTTRWYISGTGIT